MNLPGKIISGGQTGVDQGALDFALKYGIECGGWCPKGRQCESGVIPDIYPLKEVEIDDYDERTRRNVQEADATLVITAGERKEKGTRLTIRRAEKISKPYFHIELQDLSNPLGKYGRQGDQSGLQNLSTMDLTMLNQARSWLRHGNYDILNIAGNRESTSPGIQKFTVRLLEFLFEME
ncbi:putative molybdenum carrier protein [Bacteroidota bacterium]